MSELKLTTTALSPGEFFDRFTILVRKAKFSGDYQERVDEFVKILIENDLPGEMIYNLCQLMMTNTDIWNLESEIRQGNELDLGLKEVGRRALNIRDENKRRIDVVNRLNAQFGDNRKETKHDHASQ